MSEQPPRPSGQLPLPGEAVAHRLEPDPEAPPMTPPRKTTGATPYGTPPGPAHPAPGLAPAAPEERIRGSAGEGLDRAADVARRLGHRAREQGGIAGRAEPIAYRVGDSLQNAAAYVREHDVQSMREDVEVGVRASPLKSLVIAAFGGFLLGRLLR